MHFATARMLLRKIERPRLASSAHKVTGGSRKGWAICLWVMEVGINNFGVCHIIKADLYQLYFDPGALLKIFQHVFKDCVIRQGFLTCSPKLHEAQMVPAKTFCACDSSIATTFHSTHVDVHRTEDYTEH
jgi:hypothetical protein